ncbi:hypothetical protein R5R35_012551 [Gryllus longicercus]|uniref:Uncharacterized protein n=1 Tax=Gryllus longicercus TaxID=2509291 RepID=A0AAN9VG65_9ORTH
MMDDLSQGAAPANGVAPAMEAPEAVEALPGPRAPYRLLRPPGQTSAAHLSGVIAQLIGRCLDDDADPDAPALCVRLMAKL